MSNRSFGRLLFRVGERWTSFSVDPIISYRLIRLVAGGTLCTKTYDLKSRYLACNPRRSAHVSQRGIPVGQLIIVALPAIGGDGAPLALKN